MTQKDYILLAAALSKPIGAFPTQVENHTARCVWEEIVRNIADALQDDNPRFDRTRFLRACGMEVIDGDSHA